MFDYVVHKPTQENGKSRYATTTVSLIVHGLAVLLAVGLPILYASDELPEPPDMMAFVVDAPPPPPPPPPPAPKPAEKKPEPAKPAANTVKVVEKPITETRPVAAAPVEAPSAVKPETGLEGGASTSGASKVEAGFERGVTGGIVGGVVGGVDTVAPPPPPPPPAPKPEGPVRVGGKIKAPQLAHRVNPTYPPMAQAAQTEGIVVLEATVDKSGSVRNVRIVRGNPLLDAAAIAAVKQWRYEPLLLNGEAAEFILTVTVNFSIPR